MGDLGFLPSVPHATEPLNRPVLAPPTMARAGFSFLVSAQRLVTVPRLALSDAPVWRSLERHHGRNLSRLREKLLCERAELACNAFVVAAPGQFPAALGVCS
jgi:hypothetical protein